MTDGESINKDHIWFVAYTQGIGGGLMFGGAAAHFEFREWVPAITIAIGGAFILIGILTERYVMDTDE